MSEAPPRAVAPESWRRYLPNGGPPAPVASAEAKARDAAEWEQILKHPRRVSWRQAAEMMGTVRLMAADRVASERRRPW